MIDVVVRWQQDKYGKEAWEDIEENPGKCEGKRWRGNIREKYRKIRREPSFQS